MEKIINNARYDYHKMLFDTDTITISPAGIASIADSSSNPSMSIAKRMLEILEANGHQVHIRTKLKGQTSGNQFEQITAVFLRNTFPHLQVSRPGTWHILQLGNNNSIKTSDFYQYEHLAYFNELVKADTKLKAALGNDYVVAPDIVIYKDLLTDEELNSLEPVIGEEYGKLTWTRKVNGGKPVLHASVSAKITMRSDRAQNSRTEALNLIRNRKGVLPHIDVVTCEPTPNRISSLALGTGDVDCVYHFALPELIQAVHQVGSDDAKEMLETLVQGRRLKDIADLPLDLAI